MAGGLMDLCWFNSNGYIMFLGLIYGAVAGMRLGGMEAD